MSLRAICDSWNAGPSCRRRHTRPRNPWRRQACRWRWACQPGCPGTLATLCAPAKMRGITGPRLRARVALRGPGTWARLRFIQPSAVLLRPGSPIPCSPGRRSATASGQASRWHGQRPAAWLPRACSGSRGRMRARSVRPGRARRLPGPGLGGDGAAGLVVARIAVGHHHAGVRPPRRRRKTTTNRGVRADVAPVSLASARRPSPMRRSRSSCQPRRRVGKRSRGGSCRGLSSRVQRFMKSGLPSSRAACVAGGGLSQHRLGALRQARTQRGLDEPTSRGRALPAPGRAPWGLRRPWPGRAAQALLLDHLTRRAAAAVRWPARWRRRPAGDGVGVQPGLRGVLVPVWRGAAITAACPVAAWPPPAG